MALTIAQPDGPINIAVNLYGDAQGGALVATPLPSGATVVTPLEGTIQILGAVVMGQIVNGSFDQSLP